MDSHQRMGNRRPAYRGQERRSGQRRERSQAPQLHGRGRQTAGQRRRNAGGYQLQRHPINFAGRRAFANTLDLRLLAIGVVLLIVVILIIFNVVSCVNSSGDDAQPQVSGNVSEAISSALTERLEADQQISTIAASADKYPEGLIALALTEPSAVSFVAGYPDASHDPVAYTGNAQKGTVGALYTWNQHWGAMDYAQQPFALTGSGPVVAAMARMALLGDATQTPISIAEAVEAAGLASGDSGTASSYFTDHAADLGLAASTVDMTKPVSGGTDPTAVPEGEGEEGQAAELPTLSAADLGSRFVSTLGDSTYLAIETKGGALGSAAHWVLVTKGPDGAVTVYDPTSTFNTGHAWDPATVASDTTIAIALKPAE